MKHLFCGEIGNDLVMVWCMENAKYLQHDQFMYGYDWASDHTEGVMFTNNDHFLNGIRVAVIEGKCKPENIEIIYYPAEGPATYYGISLLLNKYGHLDHWPEGFFDEWDKALERLLKGIMGSCDEK